MKTVGYARISRESERGVSLEAQIAKIRAMAEIQGVELVDVIVDDGESAKSLDRPGMQRLFKMADSCFVGQIITAKLDRITRSIKDLAELLDLFSRRGIALVSVGENMDTASASGRLIMNLLMSVSQWEREVIGERTRQALQFKKAQGQRIGGIPFGYRLAVKHLEPNESEQATLLRMKQLKSQHYTLREISNALNRSGYTTRKESSWHHVYVGEMLRAVAA